MKLQWIIGIDEVGRGPLAGPVYVCAAKMRLGAYKKMQWIHKDCELRDSKKMLQKHRALWHDCALVWKKKDILEFCIARKSATYIDKNGISSAIRECISCVLQKLGADSMTTLIELDGSLYAPGHFLNQKTYIKGDDSRKIISLASVIAKESRDAYMKKLHKKIPQYNWEQNKGYGTKAHQKSIQENGITRFHRKSFLTSTPF